MEHRVSIDEPHLLEMTAPVDRTHEHDEDPLEHIGEPVHVDYDTGEVHPVGQPDPDASADPAP